MNPLFSHSLNSHLHHSSQFYLCITDSSGHIVDYNQLFGNAFAAKDQALHGESFRNLVAPGEELSLQEAMSSVANTKKSQAATFTHMVPDGTYATVSWELCPTEEEGKSLIHWLGVGEKHRVGPGKNILELWERYEAYEYSAEGLWKVELRQPVSVRLSPEEIIAHCRQHAYLADCNDNMARMYGFAKAGELIGASLEQLMDLNDQERLQNLVSFIKNNFVLTRVETKEFDRHGDVLYFLNNMTGIVEKGMLTRIWGTQQDITELKKTEERLQQSEQFYRNLIADSSDGILLTNQKGCISFVSGSVQKLLGYRPAELIDTYIFDFLHPDDLELGLATFFNEPGDSEKQRMIRVRLRKHNGEWLWCMVRGHNMFSNPHVNAMLIYFSDDTIAKMTEDALKESEQKFRNVIQNLTLGVILVDGKGEMLIYNKATADMFELSGNDLIGTNLKDTPVQCVQEDGSRFEVEDFPVVVALRTRKSVSGVVMGILKPAGRETMWLMVSADPVLNAAGEIIYVISSFTDISEHKKLSSQLIDQQRVLMQATIDAQEKERREIGRELHDNISQHITTTRLYLEVAKEKASGEVLTMINQAHKGLLDTVKEIRQLSHSLVPPSLNDIGLLASVEDMVTPLARAEAYHIRFEHHLCNEDLFNENMKLMLFRIIQEQINNIVKHASATDVHIRLETLNGKGVLVVSDNGHGFDKKLVKKGIGFVNMTNRANLFGGTLSIDTSPGNGCSIRVEIPLAQGVQQP